MPSPRPIIVPAAIAALSRHLAAQCDPQWLPGGWHLGFDGPITASTVWDPDGPGPAPPELVVAGTFTIAGDEPAAGVASWDGLRWRPIGDGLAGTPNALTVHDGQLIVGGDFTTAGPSHAANIAQLNGATWESLGPGISSPVSALGSLDGNLVAAASDGYTAPSRVLRWTGEAWEQMGQDMQGPIGAVLMFENQPTLAGAMGVMRLGGGTWVRLGALQTADTAIIWNAQLIAGTGGFITAHDVFRWDGAVWQPMYAGLIAPFQQTWVNVFGVYNGTLIGCGEVFATTGAGLPAWNGSSWVGLAGASTQYLPVPDQVATLTQYRDELLAGGAFGLAGTIAANNLARWNGQSWSACSDLPIVGPDELNYYGSALVSAVAPFAGGFAVGGSFHLDTDEGPALNVALWNGASWRPLGPGLSSTWFQETVNALIEYQGDLVAGGDFAEFPPFVEGAARWDGQAWRPMGLNAVVYALTDFNGDLIAGLWESGVRRWNGASWDPLGSPPNDTVHAFAAYHGDLIAAGRFTAAGGAGAANIARWNGSQWSALGNGLPFPVAALTVFADRLVAAGPPASTPGYMSYWDGASWHPWPVAPTIPLAFISALASDATSLYLGGSFATLAGLPVNSIARWDGTAWHTMGSGLHGAAAALLSHAGQVIVAGAFTSAGGRASPNVAIWGPPPPTCYPNCDCSAAPPLLTINDFVCFLGRFAAGDPYANCDQSTSPPTLNIADLACFLNRFAEGCP
jgi:hypothetical protein